MGRRHKIHLASNLSFNTDVITEVINIIAKRGSGKTYTATKLAEEMLTIGAQTVVIDPVGNWYGLRLGADGKAEGGLNITVLGGRNGDIPIEHTAGKLVAKTLVETGMSVILDVSLLSKPKQRRFITDFAAALLEYRKRDPSAMHIFWEEAYRFMPQKMAKGSKNEMLEATEELVTMGRNFGIGGTIISVRSALVSKTVLSQASVLIAMNTTGKGDKKTITDWMQVKELDHEAELIVNLASLKKGEAYVWWPEEFGVKHVQIDKKTTYNASATPKFGEKTRRRKLRPVDLDALQSAMKETIEKFKSEDPRLLKRRIAELEKQLAEERSKPSEVKIEAVPVFDEDFMKNVTGAMGEIEDITEKVRKEIAKAISRKPKTNGVSSSAGVTMSATIKTDVPDKNGNIIPKKVMKKAVQEYADGVKIGGGALRMIKALAAMSPGGLTKKQVASAAKMKSTSGTYSTYWGKIHSAGFVEQRGSLWYITSAGLDYLGDDIPEQPDSPEEKIEFWCEKLPGKMREVLRHLFAHQDEAFTKEEIGDLVGLVHTSGTFSTYLGKLTSNNLAVKVGKNQYQISPDLLV